MSKEDDERHTVLHDACLRGDLEQVKSLAKLKKTNVNEKGVMGWTPLHYAARGGWKEVVQVLVEQGATVSLQTKLQDSALHLAAEAGHVKVVRALLEAKANPSLQDAKGRTAKARATSDEIQGLLAANETSVAIESLSAAALQAQMRELSAKLEGLHKEHEALQKANEQVKFSVKTLEAEILEKSPLKALIVSCGTFNDTVFPALPHVSRSTAALQKALVSCCGYSSANIIVAENPTLQEFQEAMTKMHQIDFARPSSTMMIYVASHTFYDSLTRSSHLVLKDTSMKNIAETSVDMTQLSKEVANCGAKRQILVYDAMMHLKDNSSLSTRERALDELADRCRGTLVLTACGVGQLAECTPPLPDSNAQSDFVASLISAMKGEFGGDKLRSDTRVLQLVKNSTSTGHVTASQLLEFLSIAMQKQQRPIYLNASTALIHDFTVSLI